jgi:hypothetical protein
MLAFFGAGRLPLEVAVIHISNRVIVRDQPWSLSFRRTARDAHTIQHVEVARRIQWKPALRFHTTILESMEVLLSDVFSSRL